MGNTPTTPLVERNVDQEFADRTRELDIKEREVAAKEREVLAKEQELKRSRWLNPTVIGLFAAALGLIGSVVVARVNNSNTLAVEKLHSQSELVLEAIKTGNSDAACRNLLFFVGLGLLKDSDSSTIAFQCAAAPKGGPSLPLDHALSPLGDFLLLEAIVQDGASRKPIWGAEVDARLNPNYKFTSQSDENGLVEIFDTASSRARVINLTVSKQGYETNNVSEYTHQSEPVTIFLKRTQ